MAAMFDMAIAFTKAGQDMWRLGVQSAETYAAAGRVIEKRSGVIGAALRDPLAADYGELGLMGSEKSAAFSASGLSLWNDWVKLQAEMVEQMRDFGTLATWMADPRALATSSRMAQRSARMTTLAAEMGGKALAPVHKAATANDRRLRK
ncbi:hypothetical protein ABC347_02475 [Sphingomonas sp. 1P06PA]|uniref:hypothetical protein n=1 Tax=Sphingomonas sp. 1P06PA TaxID=554121 RepID=UPI0039A41FFC